MWRKRKVRESLWLLRDMLEIGFFFIHPVHIVNISLKLKPFSKLNALYWVLLHHIRVTLHKQLSIKQTFGFEYLMKYLYNGKTWDIYITIPPPWAARNINITCCIKDIHFTYDVQESCGFIGIDLHFLI